MNPYRFIGSTDWHVGRDGNPPAYTEAIANHIVSLAPAGCFDLGDCKDHVGASSAPELVSYKALVRDVLPWAHVNPGVNAKKPLTPGNHDEFGDYQDPGPGNFSLFDAALWGPPYHFTCDWPEPRIRFVVIHSRLVHPNDTVVYPGFATTESAEWAWLDNELDLLPEGWQAIIGSHFPLHPGYGNNIGHWSWLPHGGTEIRAILMAHAPRVTAYMNGHRHANLNASILDGIPHFNMPGVAYAGGQPSGGIVPIDYNPVARSLTFSYHIARPPFNPLAGFTPIVVQLPPLPDAPTTYTFSANSTLQGPGPLSGAPVTASGTVDAVGTTVTDKTCNVVVGS